MWDINRSDSNVEDAKCPQCGEPMADMGLDFEAPKMKDVKAWAHIKALYSVGITFHSCGCSGPGYIPLSKEMLLQHFQEIRESYQRQLDFWQSRRAPLTHWEKTSTKSPARDFQDNIPYNMRPLGELEEARKYWIGRINDISARLKIIGQ